MARLLHRLGAFAHRRRLAVVVVWLGTLFAAVLGAGALSGSTSNEFEIPGQESTKALEILSERFGTESSDGATATLVIQGASGGNAEDLGTAENREAIAALLGQLRAIDGVVSVSDPFDPDVPTTSADRTTAYTVVDFDKAPLDLTPGTGDTLTETASDAAGAGLSVDLTGSAMIDSAAGAHAAELIGIVVALLVLAVTYGALVVAGMNLLTALIGVGIGLMGITAATGLIELQSTTPTLATMLGLAVGVDYALFIVSRFRAELRAGSQVGAAVATAVATAGTAVVVAGLTVVIALAGLGVVGIPFLTEMGLAGAFTVVVAVLVSITLTPAVLSYLGHRALPRRERNAHLADAGTPSESSPEASAAVRQRSDGFYGRWVGFVTRQPLVTLLATTITLCALSVPLLSMQTTLESEPVPGTTQERAEHTLADAFGPGSQGQITILIDGDDAVEMSQNLRSTAQALDGVAAVGEAVPNADGTAATVTVVPLSGPGEDETKQLVGDLRGAADELGSEADIYVTGRTAVTVDVADALSDALPVYLALIVGLALILLVMVFRSLLVPAIGVAGFLLTIGASLGATVAVFQWGWMADLFALENTGPLMSLSPILTVGILFGLAMDYQIFLVSRMHEAHLRGHDPVSAIRDGFRHAAPVVVAAAVIMFAIFAGFFPGGDDTLKAIAFSLACGIAFDAIVVRMMFVPAAMTLAGGRAWVLPGWLKWLPTLDVEGNHAAAVPEDAPLRPTRPEPVHSPEP